MFKYRDHRELLVDSMETEREFESRSDLVEYLQRSTDEFADGKYDCRDITIESYGFDERIGWNTHIVSLEGYGVFGFTDGPVREG